MLLEPPILIAPVIVPPAKFNLAASKAASAAVALTTSASIEVLILVTDESNESSKSEIEASTVSIAFILSEISVFKESVNIEMLEVNVTSKVEIVS